MSERLWYFAYGSNMQLATFQGRRGIAYARAVTARLRGWRLVLDKPPLFDTPNTFANVVPDPQADVLGVAYDIGVDDMAHVDLTEGVLIDNYRRVPVVLEPLDGGSPIAAHTLTSPRRSPIVSPSPRYMGLLIAGAEEHGLPAEWITWLRAIPTVEESEDIQSLRAAIDDALRRR